ncbi:hypothetical protein HHI36_023825 [Cryptolaemus montrouzieri]|uniref:MADF domain-containing protein n=1 Tax=Cryptolaemus montrouzieri TaxID=559131 RepID=A0ABD2PI98_9CUCU
MRWTEEKTVKFHELYEDKACWWDNTSKNYRYEQLRDSAIQSIVNEMEIEEFGPNEYNDVKNKMKIYGPYSQEKCEIEKSQKSGAGAEEINEDEDDNCLDNDYPATPLNNNNSVRINIRKQRKQQQLPRVLPHKKEGDKT